MRIKKRIEQTRPYFECRSLGARFILVVVALCIVTMGVTAYLNYKSLHDAQIQQLYAKGRLLGNFVALVSPEAILSYDFTLLDQYMREVSLQEDIVYSVIVSPLGQSLTSYLDRDHPLIGNAKGSDILDIISNVNQNPEIVRQHFAIQVVDELIGTIEIGISTRRINALALQALGNTLLQNSAIIALLCLSIYLVFRFYTLIPIIKLIDSFKRVADGELSHRANIQSGDELGKLATAFNLMTGSLESSYLKLQNNNEELLRATKAKSAFLANMSHEIRTPLTAIIGFAESLLEPDVCEQERNSSINTIIRNGNHLKKIINDILDLSKIEADKLEIEIDNTSPFEVLQDVAALIDLQAKEKGLEFELNYQFPIPLNIQTDALRLKQVLINLGNNAVKFTSQGKIAIEVSYKIDINTIYFCVSDTGIGLKEDQKHKIFEEFTQADSSITRKFGGTGLGLALSKRLCTMLGGDISIESSFGQGSRFTASISAGQLDEVQFAYAPPDLFAADAQQQRNFNPERITGNILLAEDTVDNQRLIQILLDKTQAKLDIAQNGKQAVAMALDNDYDVVLMDMMMPVMSGVEATTNLRRRGYTKPIVAITANTVKHDLELYKNIGCNSVIAKPIDQQLLIRTLATYMTNQKTADAKAQGSAASAIAKPCGDARPTPDQNPAGAGKILLAEDTVDNQRLIGLYMKRLGYTLVTVDNGEQAVDAAQRQNFDAVLMDMQMPVMDGLEATRRLRANGYTVPIIALTGNAQPEEIDQYRAVGCNSFVEKPFTFPVLAAALERFVNTSGKNSTAPDKSDAAPLRAMLPGRGSEEAQWSAAVSLYKNRLSSIGENIQQALNRQDWSELGRIMHNLKGSGGTFGFPVLTEIATDIAQLIADSNTRDINKRLAQLLCIIDQTVHASVDKPAVLEMENHPANNADSEQKPTRCLNHDNVAKFEDINSMLDHAFATRQWDKLTALIDLLSQPNAGADTTQPLTQLTVQIHEAIANKQYQFLTEPLREFKQAYERLQRQHSPSELKQRSAEN